MDETIKTELMALLKNVEFDVPMKTRTSFKVGGPADLIAAPADVGELRMLLEYARKKGLPVFILGRGTNLLVLDGGIRGIVIDLKLFNTLELKGDGLLSAGSGLSLAKTIYFAMDNSLSGLEFAAGIPGSIGGAIMMNAGTSEGEMKDVVKSVTIMKNDGSVMEHEREDLAFSYRNLPLPRGSMVINALFQLRKGDKEIMKEKVNRILQTRKDKQPLSLPNAGSVFKNPPVSPAGRIIDEVGLKGLQFGGAKISELHANFIVNTGTATAKDILALMDDVMEKVYEKRGVMLEPEIKIVGEMERRGIRVKS